jgi:hypothetical protein
MTMFRKEILCVLKLLLALPLCVYSQEKFSPTVVILSPANINVSDSSIMEEISPYTIEQELSDEFKKGFLNPGLAPNWRRIRERELEFMPQQNFFTMISLNISRELAYLEVDHRPNMVIYPVKETSINDLVTYKKLCDKFQVSWVINPIMVELLSIGGKREMRLKVYLYNVVTHRLYVDKLYTLNETALTEVDSCNSTWLCLSQAVQQLAIADLFDKIEKNIRHNR